MHTVPSSPICLEYRQLRQDGVKNGTPIPYELATAYFEDLRADKWYEPLHVYVDDVDYGPAEEWGDEKPARPEA